MLISNLNQNTLFRLDNFVSTQYPHLAVGTESMTERLRRISYAAMLGFLKQSSLQELAGHPQSGTVSGVNSLGTTPGAPPPTIGSNFQAAGVAMASTVDSTTEDPSP